MLEMRQQAARVNGLLRRSARAADAALSLSRVLVAENTLGDEDILTMEELYPYWESGFPLRQGDVVRYGSRLYKTLLAHISQADWTPDRAGTLFTVVRTSAENGAPLLWVAGELVNTGDVRVYESISYRCRQSHTTLAGWEPPRTPSLWEAV